MTGGGSNPVVESVVEFVVEVVVARVLQTAPTPPRMAARTWALEKGAPPTTARVSMEAPPTTARTWALEKGDGGALGEGGVLGSIDEVAKLGAIDKVAELGSIDKVAELGPLDAQVRGAVVGGASIDAGAVVGGASIDPASARSSANGPGAARSAVVAPLWRTRPACSVR